MKLKSCLLPVLLMAALSACDRVDPNSPLGQRKAIFKQMLHTSENLGGMLRGRIDFDAKAFREGAQHLDELSQQPWQHFPQIREDDSDASEQVWKQQARFQALAKDLEQSTAALVAASTVEPLEPQALAAPVQRVEDACSACHKEFRAY